MTKQDDGSTSFDSMRHWFFRGLLLLGGGVVMCHGAEVDQGRQCAQLDPVARAQLEASFTQYVFNTTKTRSKLGEVCVSKRAQVVADVRTKGIQETDGALLSYKAKCRYSDQSRTWSCNYLTTEREVRRRNNSAAVIRGDVDYAKAISIVRS